MIEPIRAKKERRLENLQSRTVYNWIVVCVVAIVFTILHKILFIGPVLQKGEKYFMKKAFGLHL